MGTGVRALCQEEVWRLNGGDYRRWEEFQTYCVEYNRTESWVRTLLASALPDEVAEGFCAMLLRQVGTTTTRCGYNLKVQLKRKKVTFKEPVVEIDRGTVDQPVTLDTEEARLQARQKLVTGADAKASQAITRVGWKQWVIYCEERGRSPWLDTVGPNEAEVLVLDWIAYLTYVLKRAASTVRGKVGAISLSHVVEGKGNPIDAMDRVRSYKC